MAAQELPQLFGLIPTGSPCITAPTTAPSQTSFVYNLPLNASRPFSHITVFLLPGITLPINTAAAVYIALPASGNAAPSFKFLGGVGPGKESAVFKVSGLGGNGGTGGNGGEVDMDAPYPSFSGTSGEVTLGISLESAESVSSQMASLHPTASDPASAQALVLARNAVVKKPDTLILAQRIIKNAFNFLTSFSGNVNGGIEVVPLKAFEEWWKKFEGRVRSDPGFLEREQD